MVFVLDNYDSFTYNLVQYLGELDAEPVVVRNDEVDVAHLLELHADGLLISPGPGRPEDAGISSEAISEFGRRGIPVLGVCLGHQCIGQIFGGTVIRAPEIMHGKTSLIYHDLSGVFAGLTVPFQATRYHSLIVESATLPDTLIRTAWTEDGIIMGLRHIELPIEGVQFHPESILTPEGHHLLDNFVAKAEVGVTLP